MKNGIKSWSTSEDRQDVTLGTFCHELTKLNSHRRMYHFRHLEKVLVFVSQYYSIVSGKYTSRIRLFSKKKRRIEG
jgi:hypothetical protein